jgi:hypothetical protein
MIKKVDKNTSGSVYTTLMVKKTTRDRLMSYGGMGDTYDSLINRTLDQIDTTNGVEQPKQKGKK